MFSVVFMAMQKLSHFVYQIIYVDITTQLSCSLLTGPLWLFQFHVVDAPTSIRNYNLYCVLFPRHFVSASVDVVDAAQGFPLSLHVHHIYICFSFLLSHLVAVRKLHLFFYANLDSAVVSLSLGLCSHLSGLIPQSVANICFGS